MKTKSVEYAYPTSSSACKFGFGKMGCYVLKLGPANYIKPHTAIAGFATEAEAFNAADARPEPYARYGIVPPFDAKCEG